MSYVWQFKVCVLHSWIRNTKRKYIYHCKIINDLRCNDFEIWDMHWPGERTQFITKFPEPNKKKYFLKKWLLYP